ncbi:MAG: hypothetical protein R2863_05690 [Candidatus Kapaibacterium sp.]
MVRPHSFHIPVMGIGFTIDTPLKVAHLGIDSVISLVDDMLLERLRKMYSEKFSVPYEEITKKAEDLRARRITAYLNLINEFAEKKFEKLKDLTNNQGKELKEYFKLLPDTSKLKQEFNELLAKVSDISELRSWVESNVKMGSIDVNIMTKVDKENYVKKQQLPVEYNDAHAALRGYALSDLKSSIVLSAGMNPRLFSYMENFDDFYANENGEIKKKIILKVSDYRSAIIQGKYLAKKGIWVSEYRIESGLNCGGHAFATDGFLLGPALEEFKERREELYNDVYSVLESALERKEKPIPKVKLDMRITAQGGVGTSEEHNFLLDYYGMDSVGWGTPFLLVPSVTTVDNKTRQQLVEAKEKDLYLSGISPLGVPFNSMRGNTKDKERDENIDKGRPGSSCPKGYVQLNKEFGEKAICTASRQYQRLKIKSLQDQNLPEDEYKFEYNKVIDRSCTCVGLGTTALIAHGLETRVEGAGVSICPGPNMAYYDKLISMKDMIGHIYGRKNIISRSDRPHMFVKELNLYIDYLKNKVAEASRTPTEKEQNYLSKFAVNLEEGVNYYFNLLDGAGKTISNRELIKEQMKDSLTSLKLLKLKIDNLMLFKIKRSEDVKETREIAFKESALTHKKKSIVSFGQFL